MSEQINSMKYIDQLNDFAAKIAYEWKKFKFDIFKQSCFFAKRAWY